MQYMSHYSIAFLGRVLQICSLITTSWSFMFPGIFFYLTTSYSVAIDLVMLNFFFCYCSWFVLLSIVCLCSALYSEISKLDVCRVCKTLFYSLWFDLGSQYLPTTLIVLLRKRLRSSWRHLLWVPSTRNRIKVRFKEDSLKVAIIDDIFECNPKLLVM